MQRYRLASPELKLPMPERGRGVFFTADVDGEAINSLNPYYARMIASGEIVPVEEVAPEAQTQTDAASSKKTKGN